MSFFVIGPMSAFMTWICFCFSRTSRASSEPSESAFTTIPVWSVWISSSISSANSSEISFRLLLIIWKGMPGRISFFETIWILSPAAALTSDLVSKPLFNGLVSWMFRIFVTIGSPSIDAIAISSVFFSLPS